LNSKLIRSKLYYRAQWLGHGPDYRYYPASDFENAPNLVATFYRRYPNKPRPDDVLASS